MSHEYLPITTAGIFPEKFGGEIAFLEHKRLAVILFALLMVLGFGLRVGDLGAESLGEDELNKLETVAEYRTNGLTGKNGEHPFLMKGLQTASISGAETLRSAGYQISEEAALRFPLTIAGTLSGLLIFLLVTELFGRSIGFVSGAFWLLEPTAVGFDRIAKEDGLVLFFFLLTIFLWVRGQTKAELGSKNWHWYAWAAGAGFAGLMASKYYPHLLAILGAYYIVFQYLPETRWRMGPTRWLWFFAVMGFAFLILNPTILLPETWREMLKFSTENRIGHDSYEYIGRLYPNKMTAWLAGVPWTFYYVFIAVKTSLPILILFLVGIPLMFRRRMGDGRFLIAFWAFMWFLPFTFLGGKFTRYFTFAEPLILITAATGFCFLVRWASARMKLGDSVLTVVQGVALVGTLGTQLALSITTAPHFRLFTNRIGGGSANAGSYFPHDEFYDAASGDTVAEIARIARPGAAVASETPSLFAHYAQKHGRGDLHFVSLSDRSKVLQMVPGDVVVLTEGRRYLSNSEYTRYLRESIGPASEAKLGGVTATRTYVLDVVSVEAIRLIAAR